MKRELTWEVTEKWSDKEPRKMGVAGIGCTRRRKLRKKGDNEREWKNKSLNKRWFDGEKDLSLAFDEQIGICYEWRKLVFGLFGDTKGKALAVRSNFHSFMTCSRKLLEFDS
ncbi:hypothetical protein V6N11_065592 [Hibiscus sabdariffa]|uniref:Uncharacterized protein n=1 Tax=Hibiscus sabdariffa TaxID=183260 RepID=A0ABR2PIH7_9ROSI